LSLFLFDSSHLRLILFLTNKRKHYIFTRFEQLKQRYFTP